MAAVGDGRGPGADTGSREWGRRSWACLGGRSCPRSGKSRSEVAGWVGYTAMPDRLRMALERIGVREHGPAVADTAGLRVYYAGCMLNGSGVSEERRRRTRDD